MTYDMKSAGHEDVQQEKNVVVTNDPEIVEFHKFLRTRTDRLRQMSSHDKMNEEIGQFFQGRTWSQDRIKAAFEHPEFPSDMPRYRPFALKFSQQKRDTYFPTLRHAADNVLTHVLNDTRTRNIPDSTMVDLFNDMGNQSHRVLVLDDCRSGISNKTRVHFITGQETSHTLCIRKYATSNFVAGERFAHSVIVEAGKLGNATRNICNCNLTLNIEQEKIELDNAPIWSFTHTITQDSPLRPLFEEVVEQVKDPYSLHTRYGATPGPAIFQNFKDIARNYWPEEITKYEEYTNKKFSEKYA